jgi:phage shock protein C
MFCNACGKTIADDARVCSYCGASVAGARTGLVRPRVGRRIAGVCLGVARQYGWSVTLLRVLWLLFVLFAGTGVLAYIILWIVIPSEA